MTPLDDLDRAVYIALSLPRTTMDKTHEFPDGGRANLVRRFSPPLTRRQLDILLRCPYERPGKFDLRRHPLKLVELGLLEEDPQTKNIFRCTEAGTAVAQQWVWAGWAP